jgi:ribosomal protein S12 methylthiotransferase
MRFHIVTLGCPKNQVDSEGMAQLLAAAGHIESESAEDADCVVVNTCAFIAPAREESLETLLELAREKKPGQTLVAAGCMPERYGSALRRQVPELDGLVGTRRWARIVPLVEMLRRGRQRGELVDLVSEGESSLVATFPRGATAGFSAYLKIADGCSAPCAFCAIPAIKGPQRSKPRAQILAEARQLVEGGIKEIILIAQDTTSYGRDLGERDALPELIKELAEGVPELPWLRIMYSYPQHVTPRLIEVMTGHPQVCHYLDVPLQHGHPDVLRRMGRPSDTERTVRLINDLRKAMPDIALRTAFIVGYPGETEDEFDALLGFMERSAFDKVGIFTYSAEEGTPAAALPGQLPEALKSERFDRAMLLQQRISLERNRAQVGLRLDVLVEGAGDGISVGRTYRDAPEIDGLVLVEEDCTPGEMVPVRITSAMEYDLVGELEAPGGDVSAGEGILL